MRCVFSVSDGVVYLDTSGLGISHAYEGHVSCLASKWTFETIRHPGCCRFQCQHCHRLSVVY